MTDKATFSATEWDLLVRMPNWVVAAASAAQRDGALGSAAEKEVGMVSIAWGRDSGNAFVAEIAELLTYSDEPAEAVADAPDFTDPAAGLADVVERARGASQLLAAKADHADAAAYRSWLLSIADAVIAAARSGGVFGLGKDVSDPERQFRDELGKAVQA